MTSILIATSDHSAGGIQRALADQLSLLQEIDDVTITVLSPASDFAKNITAQGVPLLALTSWRKTVFRHLPALSGLGLSQRFDIALCHNGFMARGLRQIARHVIGICHNDKPTHFTGCHKLVCLSDDGVAKAKSEGWHDSQLALISHFHEVDKTYQIPPASAPLRIGAAGRMVTKKNLSLFIEIAALVKQTHPDISFELGGSGTLENSLSALNKKHGSPVSMRGWVAFDDFVRTLDIMIIPSLDEPFGFIYPETMSQGVAVLSTPTFGAKHCLDNGAITALIPADDPGAFAAQIRHYADNPDSVMQAKQACFDRACAPVFSRKTALAKWQALLTG